MDSVWKLPVIDKKLREDARKYISSKISSIPNDRNIEGILQITSGFDGVDLTSRAGITSALEKIGNTLAKERKRAKTRRYDYNLNRHIALFQAKKYLHELLENP